MHNETTGSSMGRPRTRVTEPDTAVTIGCVVTAADCDALMAASPAGGMSANLRRLIRRELARVARVEARVEARAS
ncbi:hypothetical protein FSW04_09915 [Baekduia soli]|uniref:Uncharacterized protein n=1 Tax=Baekduia soli TaxID=496014 RepID=A0A5B8U4N9_9ACTN|nr:hypothetical protein [Baekduia soli]QEC47855.1 hypothetical protein FSW04_09915 [Baekduia soli]